MPPPWGITEAEPSFPESYVFEKKRPAEFESRRFPGLIVRLSDLFSDLWG